MLKSSYILHAHKMVTLKIPCYITALFTKFFNIIIYISFKWTNSSLYTNFQTSIITDKFSTPFITVGHGVLQGDCLSPLLFNMSFNTFVQYIKSESWLQIKSYLIASQYGVNGPVCLYVLTNAPRLALKNTYPSLSNTWLNCLLTKISFLVSNLSATLVIVLISTC